MSRVEEATYTLTAAENYLNYGPWHSHLLQDFSTSSYRADHPYVYDHMPPGPDLSTAFLLWISGRSYAFMRVAFGLIYVIGIGVYVRFVSLFLRRLELPGASFAPLILGPWMLAQSMDRHVTFAIPLLAFLPVVLLDLHYRYRKRALLWAAAGVAFLSSLYLHYVALIAIVALWFFLYLTRLVERRRHLLLFLAVFASGVLVHLAQNLSYLGPVLFWKELTMTVGNRVSGIPSQTELGEFSRQVHLVSHGAHPLDLHTWVAQFLLTMRIPGWIFLALLASVISVHAAVCPLSLPRRRHNRSIDLPHRRLAPVVVLVAGVVLASMVAFPAFGQEVSLSSDARYFLAIAVVAVLAESHRVVASYGPHVVGMTRSVLRPINLLRTVFSVAAIVLAGAAVLTLYRSNQAEFRQVRQEVRQYRYVQLKDLRRFQGQLFMTNINVATPGFLVKEAGYGVCGLDAISNTGSLSPEKCKVAFMRRLDFWAGVRPRYFFFFFTPDLFPGFADCMPSGTMIGTRGGNRCMSDLEGRLSKHFRKVWKNDLFAVYDLHAFL